MNKPLRIAPARAWRTYRGGSLIAALHGEAAQDTHFPEEWLMSTVAARNPGREHIVEGLSKTADGTLLRDLIEADPEGVLGRGRSGTGMLMKLIDAAERLSVQVHPTRADAQKLFRSPFGKTECWYILGGREVNGEKPHIYFGFREGVTREQWAKLFCEQDIPGMLSCLHRIEVQPGDVYLIHGGVPHAIGAGCFLAEIQEPTDLTLRVERTGPTGDPLPDMSCHQGVGFEKMLDCFCYDGCDLQEAQRRWRIPARVLENTADYTRTALLSYEDTPFFRMERVDVHGTMNWESGESYHGFYVLEGEGIITVDGKEETLSPGVQYFVPSGSLQSRITGQLVLIKYEGPQQI